MKVPDNIRRLAQTIGCSMPKRYPVFVDSSRKEILIVGLADMYENLEECDLNDFINLDDSYELGRSGYKAVPVRSSEYTGTAKRGERIIFRR